MKKIGIYLRGASHMGGTFQYNMSIVAAAERIHNNRFSFLVAYSNDYWARELNKYDLHQIGRASCRERV